ncbi:MAG: exodeoxyribonuclease VII small subunit [Desulfobacterales bacterium]|jgi:exodeoxyribonuclease VII small subunit|nr:exodeoxyribonuclease VII small subunit [Desulfobacteraceae bacterium]MDD3992180.1 exodeoxyribonuclease VII small subunit [Desulfobacteraceae bacterium]MDY0312243.1 exodeoxyribonuclease VII small subunit [Desulfobacterales bacterium]
MAQPTFETAFKQLEKIVADLESGDPPLETAIRKFEEGMRLARLCGRKLDETEHRISKLMETDDGRVEEQPLQEGDGVNDSP